MGKTERPARGRNIGNGALMSSPYAAEVIMHAGKVIGVGPTAAVLTLGGGAAAYGVARYRDTPGKRARRDLRRASRAATTAGSPRRRVSSSRGGPSLGSKGRAKYATGARRSGHGGATSRRARSAAGHGGIGSKGRSSTSTALLDRKGKAPAGRGRAHAGSLGNRPGGRGGRSSRTPFGRGPRASAARQQAAARRGRHGGLGGLLGGGKAPKRNGHGRRRGGLSAGLGLLSGRRGWKSGSRGYWNRRRTAAARAMQRQRGVGSGAKASKGKWAGSRGVRTIAASWRPLGRLWGKPRRRGFIFALTRFLHLFARFTAALTGSVIGLAMLAPKVWQFNRFLGIAVARQVNVWRSGLAAFLNPYSAEREAERIRGAVKTTNKPKSGGSAMSDVTADHIEALIEHIRNAPTIERFAGVHIAAHAEAMARLAEALAEYAQANVDLIKEHTPTLDGGESLVQQADILAATGPALRECHEAFEAIHEDRLRRQREPEHGEEHWDVAAAQE